MFKRVIITQFRERPKQPRDASFEDRIIPGMIYSFKYDISELIKQLISEDDSRVYLKLFKSCFCRFKYLMQDSCDIYNVDKKTCINLFYDIERLLYDIEDHLIKTQGSCIVWQY